MNSLFKTIFLGWVRHGMTVGGVYLVNHGIVDQAGAQVLAGAVVAIAGLAWSAAQKVIAEKERQIALNTMPPQINAVQLAK
jgi:hypothetical protein